jgi:hypothetical protein
MAEDPKPPKPFIPPESNEETRLYWDRLDAKFANMQAAQPPAPPLAPEPPSEPAAEQAAEPPPGAPTSPPQPPSAPSGLIAEAFAALLALEDGQPGARPVRLTTGDGHSPPPPAAEPQITDAVIEEVVRRVIERIGPEAVRAVVTDVVSEISERLVKEEIDRIRKPHV